MNRDDLATLYFDSLPYEPYPVQEEALLSWFSCEQGVLVSAPTGTGKTMIAEAAVFEALHTKQQMYYTTPLIALTDQKFHELQAKAADWGFHPDDVGLITGNRRVNPEAKVLVVVAEILLNRLLHHDAFDFAEVQSVVMDEFHQFSDVERGIVWEFSLELLPPTTRTLLLSATVGGIPEFRQWLNHGTNRKLELVKSDERKVPLTFDWEGNRLLDEHLEMLAKGGDGVRFTPALVFCFNRNQCWDVAERVRGKQLVTSEQKDRIAAFLKEKDYDFSTGAGAKIKQLLVRGVGIHHAGVMPKYRRIVEEMFQNKLLSVATCTETLAAGINLPARSVVIPELHKGPADKRLLIDPSSAHQIFGRAGRPQFDDQGYVFALAHEDDVKISRWKEQYDQIPANTKDPGLLKQKKKLKKKQPKRRDGKSYWTEPQFRKLIESPPGKLQSRGPLPWRLLAYLLDASPDVEPIRKLLGRRLSSPKQIARGIETFENMLLVLHKHQFLRLDPAPPEPPEESEEGVAVPEEERPVYKPELAHPLDKLDILAKFRSVNPLYGYFLTEQLDIADEDEKLQAFESVLELPFSLGREIRVPHQRDLPPGPLATERLDARLLQLGLVSAEQLRPPTEEELEEMRERGRRNYDEERPWTLAFAEKLFTLFEYEYPAVHSVRITPVWVAGELFRYGGNFDAYINGKGLQKQEGMLFRHLLRLILLLEEFVPFPPQNIDAAAWEEQLRSLAARITESCTALDAHATQKTVEEATRRKEEVL